MTKDEAIAAIIDSRNRMKTWATYVSEVREIIDQIDQPGEFRVRELVELLKSARCDHGVVQLAFDGMWRLAGDEICGYGIDALRAKLIELAKPEDPEVMVPMRLSVVKRCAEHRAGEAAKACRAALEKLKGT